MKPKTIFVVAVWLLAICVLSVEAQRTVKKTTKTKKQDQAEQNVDAGNQSVDSLLIKGVAADAKGPLANRTVIVLPINSAGQPVTRQNGANSTLRLDGRKPANSDKWTYSYTVIGDSRLGPDMNPRTKTSANGSFTVRVPKALFSDPPGCVTCTGYKAGELGIGVFTVNVSHFEIERVMFDPNATTVNAGRLVFKTVKVKE
jgi:hypothetical protein